MREIIVLLCMLVSVELFALGAFTQGDPVTTSDGDMPELVFVEVPKGTTIASTDVDIDMTVLHAALKQTTTDHRGVGFFWLNNASMCMIYYVKNDGTVELDGYGPSNSCIECMIDPRGKDCLSSSEFLRKNVQVRNRLVFNEAMIAFSRAAADAAVAQAQAQAEVDAAWAYAAAAEAALAAAEAEAAAARADAVAARAEPNEMMGTAFEPSEVVVSAEALDLSLANLDEAQVSIASPDSIYVSNIVYDDVPYSALLRYDGGTSATVEAVFGQEGKLLPDSVRLSQTELHLISSDAISLSNVKVGEIEYSGFLQYLGGNKLQINLTPIGQP